MKRILSGHEIAVIMIAALASLLPFSTRFLPMFDYPHWVYQAHILANFEEFSEFFTVTWGVAPNFGSSLTVTILAQFLGAEDSARMVLALYAATMTLAFFYFTRRLVGQPSGAELLGGVIVYNVFFYRGFLSFVIGLPLILLTISYVVRASLPLNSHQTIIISFLSTLAYLFHLFLWLPVLFYTFIVGLRQRDRSAAGLILTQLVPLSLLAIYTVQRSSENDISIGLYGSVLDKLAALTLPLLPFSRVDPFPSPFPILPANLLAVILSILAIILLVLFSRRNTLAHSVGSVITLAVLLATVAVANPLSGFGGMGAVDQRLLFVGFIVTLSLFGLISTGKPVRAICLILSVAVLAGHYLVFTSSGRHLLQIYEAIQVRSADDSVYVASLRHPPVYGECPSSSVLNSGNGIFPLEWFMLYDLAERGGVVARTFNTAALSSKAGNDFKVKFGNYQTNAQRRMLVSQTNALKQEFDYLFVFGCWNDISSVSEIWQSKDRLVESGNYYALVDLRTDSP